MNPGGRRGLREARRGVPAPRPGRRGPLSRRPGGWLRERGAADFGWKLLAAPWAGPGPASAALATRSPPPRGRRGRAQGRPRRAAFCAVAACFALGAPPGLLQDRYSLVRGGSRERGLLRCGDARLSPPFFLRET